MKPDSSSKISRMACYRVQQVRKAGLVQTTHRVTWLSDWRSKLLSEDLAKVFRGFA